MQSYPIKKSFFQHTKISISHRTKANEQLQILSAITYCELAVKQLFFEKHQSCVCTTVTLSHRFKAFSPAVCGQNRFRHVPPKIFAKSFPAELWIVGRRASPRVLFGYSLHDAKSDNSYSLAGKLRGSANLESAHHSRSFAPQQLKPFKGASRFCKPWISIQR